MEHLLKNKKKVFAALAVVMISVTALIVISFMQKNTIEQTKDAVVIEAGQELKLEAVDFFNVTEEQKEKVVFHTEDVDVNTVGTYEMRAVFQNKTFTIEVTVEDTTPPEVTFGNRCIFTNGTKQIEQVEIVEGIYDASEYTLNLIRFEKKENLKILDEIVLKSLTDAIPLPCDEAELKVMGTEEFPQEEGIYRAVMEIVDIHGNATYEEVVMILDKTAARIEEVADKVLEVDKENLTTKPEVNPADYVITDNVDGKIEQENIVCELELRDEEKHEWLVHVSHADRAGNESKAEFLITVAEKQEQVAVNTETESSENQNTQTANTGVSSTGTSNRGNNNTGKENSGSSNTGNSGNTNSESSNTNNNGASDSQEDKQPSNEQNSNNGTTNETTKPDNSSNKNENEWTPTDDEDDISPWEQKVIDAGYGNVVDFGDGSYGVLTHNDGYVNGKRGGEILREYLAERGLEPQNVSGGVIDEDDDWRWYIADNVRELITEDDEEFWD